MRILVTGAAGFIGFFLCRALLEEGNEVWGVDNLNAYYDPALKRARLARLEHPHFRFYALDVSDAQALTEVFAQGRFSHVAHLAAQAGVRYSLTNPAAYLHSNLLGFGQILEACRQYPVEHLVYASSSSVYGMDSELPFRTTAPVRRPASLYAASKQANELMAHAYSHLYQLPCTGLRFFTVYGPWGRPDMAYFSFTRSILAGEPVPLFNHGRLQRDFTYIDDIIQGVLACIPLPPVPDASRAPHKIYNLGNRRAVSLEHFVAVLEDALQAKAKIEYLPMQPGDVFATCADIEESAKDLRFFPRVNIEEGLPRFVQWYREFYPL